MIVACAALAIATLARIFAVSMGFDSFTAFIVFLVVLVIQVIVYLSIHVVKPSVALIGNGLPALWGAPLGLGQALRQLEQRAGVRVAVHLGAPILPDQESTDFASAQLL